MFVIAVGTPFQGLLLVGDDEGYLFASVDEAIAYGTGKFDHVPWEVVDVIGGERVEVLFPRDTEEEEIPDPEEN